MKTKTLVMIRKIALLLILTLSQSLLCHVPVFAETEGSEYVSTNGDTLDHFIINEEGVLTKYLGYGGHIVIPEGVKVIDKYVFAPLHINNPYNYRYGKETEIVPADLVTISFPDSLVKIDEAAFYYGTITAVTIPEKVQYLGKSAFGVCTQLSEVTINSTEVYLSSSVFGGCKAIKIITINSENAYLKTNEEATGASGSIFSNCNELLSISFPGLKGVLGTSPFANCKNLTGIDLPEGITGASGVNADTFTGCEKLKEIILPRSCTNLGTRIIYGSSLADIAVLAPDFTTALYTNAFALASYTPRAVSIYAYPDTAAWTKLAANTIVKNNHNLKTLTRKVRVAVKNLDGSDLMYVNPSLTAAWNDSDDYGKITPSFETTVLDVWEAANKANDSGLPSVDSFTLNGERHVFADAGSLSVNDGAALYFFNSADKAYAHFESEGSRVTAVTLAPEVPYGFSLKFADSADRSAAINVFEADGRTLVPTLCTVPDADGNFSLLFQQNGTYYVTASDYVSDGIVSDLLAVTIYAPDNGIVLGAAVGTPLFDRLTPMSSGYMAGEFVRLGGNGMPIGTGFDSEHVNYNLYVAEDTTAVFIPVSLHSPVYANTLTLAAKLDNASIENFDNVVSAEGDFGDLPLTLGGGNHTLVINTSCEEQGQTFTRTYTINIVRDNNRPYAGIRNLIGALGLGVGKGTTLDEGPVTGSAMYTAYVHPGQTAAVFDVTVNAGTELYLGTKENGVKQENIQAQTETEIVYRVAVDCADPSSTPILTTCRNDRDAEITMIYTLAFKQRTAVPGVFSPDRVIDLRPARGQFISESTASQAWAYAALRAYANYMHWVCLGGHGGYVTYYYEEPIRNDPSNPYGVDFIVYGNSFEGGACNEPAGAQVSYDGVTWYDLAGQRHYELNTRYDPSVPLRDGSTTESLLLLRAEPMDQGYDGGYPKNVAWGYADVANASKRRNAEGTDWVEAEPMNPYGEFAGRGWDGEANKVKGNVGDMFDLSWAVDKAGRPVDLTTALPNGIRYIRLQNVMDVDENGPFGELSPEIGTITRVNPANVGEAAVGTTDAPRVLTINGIDALSLAGAVVTNGGRTTYGELDLQRYGSTVEVHVEGAETDNIYVNMEPFYGGTADYSGILASDEDIARGVATVAEAYSRTVRVVVQNGEREPRIYVIRCVNGGDPAKNAALSSVVLATPAEMVTLARDSGGRYAGYVDNDTKRVSFIVTALNPRAEIKFDGEPIASGERTGNYTVTLGENSFTITVASENGEVTETYEIVVTRREFTPNPGGESPNPGGGGDEIPAPSAPVVVGSLPDSATSLLPDGVEAVGEDAALFAAADGESAADALDAALPGLSGEDRDGFRVNEDTGRIEADESAVFAGMSDETAGRIAENAPARPLPAFEAEVTPGNIALVTLKVKLGGAFIGHDVSELAVLKLKRGGVTEELKPSVGFEGMADGRFIITDLNGVPATGAIAGDEYFLNVAIADNGAYDWNPVSGKVFDPLTVTLYGEPRNAANDDADGGRSSGGGCDAGFGLAGVALASLAARRRKRR